MKLQGSPESNFTEILNIGPSAPIHLPGRGSASDMFLDLKTMAVMENEIYVENFEDAELFHLMSDRE